MDPGFPRILEDFQGPKHRIQRCAWAWARNSIGFSSLHTAAPMPRRSHRDDGVDHHRKEKFESLEAKWVWGVADYSMLLLRLAYRLIAQLTFLGKVQTVDPNVSEPPLKMFPLLRHPFCPNFRPLSTSTLHRSLDFFPFWPHAKMQLFGFQIALMHLVLMLKSKNSESKTLVGKSGSVKSKYSSC